jgi:Protein of unknown function (DUF3617)
MEEEMRKMILLVAVLSSAAILLAASDLQPLNLKTGLWQVTMTSTINGLPTPNTNTYKSCVKKEDLDKYPFTDPQAKCTWTVQSSTGRKMDASGTCTPQNEGKVTFAIHLEAVDSENVKGTGQLTVNGPAGNMSGNYSGTAKWIGATCPAEMK